MNINRQTDAAGEEPGRRSIAGVVIGWFASVKFAVAIIVLIAAACVVGTLLPQGADAAAYVEKNPDAATRFSLFASLGLTHVFSARWFIALLCVLAATVMVCSTRRMVTVKRASGFAQRRALGSLLTHISILLILGGAVLRGVWGEKGRIELRVGQTLTEFETDRGARTLPFALQLAKFEIETDAAKEPAANGDQRLVVQWTARNLQASVSAIAGTSHSLTPENETPSPENTFRLEVLRYVPDFAVNATTHEVTSRSDEPNNPAILVAVNGPGYQNHRWIFAKFPEFSTHEDGTPVTASPLRLTYQNTGVAAPERGSIRNFKSTLLLLGDDRREITRTLAVNRPLRFQGYTFYQTGYNPEDPSWTALEVIRDPGVPLVYGGFVLLIGGLFTVFYLNPWLTAREAKA